MPLAFYFSTLSLLFYGVFGGVLVWLGYFVFDKSDEILIGILGGLTLIIGVLFVYVSSSLLISPKPQYLVTRYHISRYHLFNIKREKVYYFKDIEDLILDYHVYRDHKHWHMTLFMKDGQTQMLPLNKTRLNGDTLNEKELFDLIEQVFRGQIPPTRHHIDMDIHDRMTGFGILMMVVMGAMLIVAVVMGLR